MRKGSTRLQVGYRTRGAKREVKTNRDSQLTLSLIPRDLPEPALITHTPFRKADCTRDVHAAPILQHRADRKRGVDHPDVGLALARKGREADLRIEKK